MNSDDCRQDQTLVFKENDPEPIGEQLPPWNILVIDDDEEVHAATKLVLSRQILLGHPLALYNAYSAEEARQKLLEIPQLSVILLDVVMETENAGLELVRYIRDIYGMDEVRIILRTGQPGSAPEMEVVERYDINDYKTKQEMTHRHLITSMTAALRSYQQIRSINRNRDGLQEIIRTSTTLLGQHNEASFLSGIFKHLELLLEQRACFLLYSHHESRILGGAGCFSTSHHQQLESLEFPECIELVKKCLGTKKRVINGTFSAWPLLLKNDVVILLIRLNGKLDADDEQLLDVFTNNLTTSYENYHLIQQLEHTAFFDSLTGLPNRNRFIKMLDQAHKTRDAQSVVALIDIDHFADINDGLGQETGNLVLQALAQRLSAQLPECIVARVSVDIFGVYGPDPVVGPESIQTIFAEPLRADQHRIPLTVTIGYCRALEHGESGLMLFKHAAIALNRAKKNLRTRFEYYRDEMEEHMRWQLRVIDDLRSDFVNNKLEVWYQPKLDNSGTHLQGMEALSRWKNQAGDYVSPTVFIPLAEYSGLIVDIGYRVLETACKALSRLHACGYPQLCMAVNVSMPQFRDDFFVQRVSSILQKTGVKPCFIELEITESIVVDDPKLVVVMLEELRSMGIRIAIDDFGTGYSALSYLQELPIDSLKIDKSFVEKMDTPSGRSIVQTIISLAKALNLGSVAEGVEHAWQAEILRNFGCNTFQGFMFAEALPIDELVVWVKNRQGGSS